MLQAIRSKAGSLIVKILFALLIVSFGVWGIGDIFRERSAAETTVASVGDINIQADELQNAVRREMARMSSLFGAEIASEQAAHPRHLAAHGILQFVCLDVDVTDAGDRRLGGAALTEDVADAPDPEADDQQGKENLDDEGAGFRPDGLQHG